MDKGGYKLIINKITMDGILLTHPININNIDKEYRINIGLLDKLFRDFGVVANIKGFDEVLPINQNGDKLMFDILIVITPRNYQDISLTKIESFLLLHGFSFIGNIHVDSN